MFSVKYSLLIFTFALTALNANARSSHSEIIRKFYTAPVSAAQAFADLETAVAEKMKDACLGSSAEVETMSFSIPFDVKGGTMFNPEGSPGSQNSPLFIYYSYPTVTATVDFVCK